MRSLTLAIAFLAALLALSSGAQGAVLESRTKPMKDSLSGFQTGKAKCEQGEHVISGGFTGSSGDYAVVNKAVRGKAWVVKGDFTLPTTVFAYCSRRLETEQAKKTKEFDGIRADATAKCERGVAAAGGWAYKPLMTNSPVFTSRPSGFRWHVGAFAGQGNAESITSYAYCMRKELAVHQNTAALAAGGDATSLATCDEGTQLLGGGFETLPEPDFDNKTGPDPFINSEGRDDPLVWAVEAHNYSSVAGSLESFAICLP